MSEPVLAALCDSIDYGILLFGAKGELLAANGQLSDILRIEVPILSQLAHFDALVSHLAPKFYDSEALAARWRQLFQHDDASLDKVELQLPVRKTIERFARPVFGEQGQRLGWLETYRDTPVQGLVETRKLFHTDRMVVLGQLMSSVAHELNNPLASILGYAQLLRRDAASGQERAGRILEQAERACRIAKNLLLFVRETQPGRTKVDLNEVVERTVALRSYDLRLENIRVTFELENNLPMVLADAAQIQQVLLNLLLNAEQAQRPRGSMPDGRVGSITLRTHGASSKRVAIEVEDNGPGIALDVLPHIFDAFFTTKPPGVGTGLGLSIVYAIVQEHGGEVLVESRQGHGTTFRVLLPTAAPGEAEHSLRPVTMRRPVPQKDRRVAERRRSERILVVEDEPTVASLIADVLSEEGYKVDAVFDSREGLQMSKQNVYDLVICDLRMPHLDGRGVYRELRRRDHSFEQRLLFVTGDTAAAHTVNFLNKSGVPYLSKPFLVEELKEAVHNVLANNDKPSSKPIQREAKGARTTHE